MNTKTILSLTLTFLLLGTQLFAIDVVGRVEGRIGTQNSQVNDGRNLIHVERINFGLEQEFDFLALSYQVSGGGLYRGSQDLDVNQFYPEYQVRASMIPVGRMKLELFSYSQLRNPFQISRDTLRHHEQVSGFQLETPLAQGRILTALGSRSSSRAENEIASTFYKLQIEQKLLGLQFRVRGEKDLYSSGVQSSEEERSNLSVQWYGSPITGLSWTSMNTLYSFAGNNNWRIYQRVNYKLGQRNTIWSHFRNHQVNYRSSYMNTQSFDLDYRFKLGDHFALQMLSEGHKVKSLADEILYHWRAYLGGLHWRFGSQRQFTGLLQAGYKQSYRFGSGMDLRFEIEERMPLFKSRLMSLDVSDYAQGEFFFRMDDSDDPRYDIDHELRVNLDLLPGQKIQVGNTFKLLNHFGTDLDFSTDTLKNALTHNLQLKLIQRRLRVSLDHLTISELSDVEDTRLHFNTRFTYNLTRGRSLNLISMYRYQSEQYPDYLWLNGFLKVNMQVFDLALELQAQGPPDTVFDDNLSFWIRFVRNL